MRRIEARVQRCAAAGAVLVATTLAVGGFPSLAVGTVGAQAAAGSAAQGQQGSEVAGRGGRGTGRGGPVIAPLPFDDRTGFESMFDGASLNPGERQAQAAQDAARKGGAEAGGRGGQRGSGRGRGGAQASRFQDWDGDPQFWRVENGLIVGESTPDRIVNPNTFLIWRGGTPGDFELKVEIRMNAGNGGIQYRSRMLPAQQGLGGQPGHAWRLAGYQMDMDFENNYPGGLYEEGGRAFLAERGTMTYIAPDGTKGVIAALKTAEELKAAFKPGEWNGFHLVARGNTLVHIVNGLATAVCIDDDVKGRSLGGLIGFQLHSGPPMKLELRNPAIKLK